MAPGQRHKLQLGTAMKNYRTFVIVLLVTLCNTTAFSQNIRPNKKFDDVSLKVIHSTILNEDRNIFVYVPDDTTKSEFPVIYLLDGEKGLIFGNAREYARTNPHIVIGIETSNNRTRDMKPTENAEVFLRFLITELQPFINSNYHTDGHNLLIGGSLSGLFTINAMLTEPDRFFAYLAFSPPVEYCEELLLTKINNFMPKSKLDSKFLYMNYSLKREMPQVTKYLPSFSELMSNQFKNLSIRMDVVKDGRHCPEGSIEMGLDFVYGKE
jgi:hypothetical protein